MIWERSTPWITERDTAQTETERVLSTLVTAHPWIAVCIKSKRMFTHVIHVLNMSHPVWSSRVARTTRRSFSTRTSLSFSHFGCRSNLYFLKLIRSRSRQTCTALQEVNAITRRGSAKGLKNVPMDATRRRRSCMYCVQRIGQ